MARTKTFNEDEVLEKALHLFWRQGYEATSMQDLVDHLGISRSSLYDTFGDKHGLYVSALTRYRRQVSEQAVRTLARAEDPLAVIRQLLLSAATPPLKADEPSGCFMVNASVELAGLDADIRAIAGQNKAQVVQAFAEAIARGQAIGQFTTEQAADELAELLFTLHNGLQVVGKIDRDGAKRRVTVEAALALLAPC